MGILLIRTVLAAVLLSLPLFSAGGASKEPMMKLEFVAVPTPAQGVEATRFVRGGLAFSHTVTGRDVEIAWRPLGEGGANQAMQTLATFPQQRGWDGVDLQDGDIRLVSYQAGSAVAPLFTRDTRAGVTASVDERNERGVMMFPHFVRRSGPHPAITAVDVAADYAITLYPALADGGYGPRQRLPAPAIGELQDARMVALHDGYLLVTQRFQAGPYRRVDGMRGATIERSGVVEVQRLDAALRPLGAASKPFGDDAVFGFDIDSLDKTIVLFATDETGWRLMLIGPNDKPPTRLSSGTDAAPLSAPCVLLAKPGLLLSFVRNAGTQRAAILLARLPLP